MRFKTVFLLLGLSLPIACGGDDETGGATGGGTDCVETHEEDYGVGFRFDVPVPDWPGQKYDTEVTPDMVHPDPPGTEPPDDPEWITLAPNISVRPVNEVEVTANGWLAADCLICQPDFIEAVTSGAAQATLHVPLIPVPPAPNEDHCSVGVNLIVDHLGSHTYTSFGETRISDAGEVTGSGFRPTFHYYVTSNAMIGNHSVTEPVAYLFGDDQGGVYVRGADNTRQFILEGPLEETDMDLPPPMQGCFRLTTEDTGRADFLIPGPPGADSSTGQCDDGADNDCDTRLDEDDLNCQHDEACVPEGVELTHDREFAKSFGIVADAEMCTSKPRYWWSDLQARGYFAAQILNWIEPDPTITVGERPPPIRMRLGGCTVYEDGSRASNCTNREGVEPEDCAAEEYAFFGVAARWFEPGDEEPDYLKQAWPAADVASRRLAEDGLPVPPLHMVHSLGSNRPGIISGESADDRGVAYANFRSDPVLAWTGASMSYRRMHFTTNTEMRSELVIAHELGHSLGLPHDAAVQEGLGRGFMIASSPGLYSILADEADTKVCPFVADAPPGIETGPEGDCHHAPRNNPHEIWLEFSSKDNWPRRPGLGCPRERSMGVACKDPDTDVLVSSSLGTSIEELCNAVAFCAATPDLEADVTVTIVETDGQRPPPGGEKVILQASMTKVAGTVSSTEEPVAVGSGAHVIEICIDGADTGACTVRELQMTPPLGTGADAFGYHAGPMTFAAVERDFGGGDVDLAADGEKWIEFPPGFTFPFYGEDHDSILIGANGGVRFTDGEVAASNAPLGSAASEDAPEIAVFWDDLDPVAGGRVQTMFDGQRFVVSWTDIPHASNPGASGIRVQLHLYASGRIEMHYETTGLGDVELDGGGSATIGIRGPTGFVELSHGSNALLGEDEPIAFAFDTDDCIGERLQLPPTVPCTAPEVATPDLTIQACSAGSTVEIPAPSHRSLCFRDTRVDVTGSITHSGTSLASLQPLETPIPVGGGPVALTTGVHLADWFVLENGQIVAGPFTQQITVTSDPLEQNCCSAGQTIITLTDGGDILDVSSDPTPVCVLAGDGGDIVDLGDGDNTLLCGGGGDIVEPGDGDNLVVCESGPDIADGGSGADRMFGGDGPDTFDGNGGNDLLRGDDSGDILTAHAGQDVLWGGAGGDIIKGGADSDQLYPGAGNDIAKGEAGDDEFFLLDPCEITGGKIISGGSGTDTLYVPEGWTQQDVQAQGVLLTSIENVVELPSPRNHESHCF